MTFAICQRIEEETNAQIFPYYIFPFRLYRFPF